MLRVIPERCEQCDAWIGPCDDVVLTPKADIICIKCAGYVKVSFRTRSHEEKTRSLEHYAIEQ